VERKDLVFVFVREGVFEVIGMADGLASKRANKQRIAGRVMAGKV